MKNSTNATIILASQCSPEEWNAQYLLLLSYLNFEYPINLLLLPGAIHECTWSDKQWQALSLYGLKTCYHIKELPPIDSQSVNWESARQLISKTNQPLLHICHWNNRLHFENWLPMASEIDSLLLFGNPGQADAQWLSQRWPNNQQHVVSEVNHPHICSDNDINKHKWTNIIIQSPVTLAWN